MTDEHATAHRLADGTQVNDVAYRDADEWPLPNGDTVVVVERTFTADGQAARSFTWHLRARNGKSVQGGGETFVSKWNAKRSALRHFPRVGEGE